MKVTEWSSWQLKGIYLFHFNNDLRFCLKLLIAIELLELLKVELLKNKTFESKFFIKNYLLLGNHIYKVP